MNWTREGFESHVGAVGVLLADGNEPRPIYFDLGSGGHFEKSTDWWVYDGTMRRPTATTLRGRCVCGWRGEGTYPVDWEQVRDDGPGGYDTSGPERDWDEHMDQVAAVALALPDDLADLLRRLRGCLDELLDDAPLAVVKAAGELEAIVTDTGPAAASLVRKAETPLSRIAELLGMTEKEAESRLDHYWYLGL
ncbi:hypothetical protein ACFXOM_25275 [Streptomyces sp. NPDC059169]|uniref:hypothetical protein n=1 Tax=Streptomyces sp. NPDC059169 TaxID=3346754 RepID=UPI0036A7650A